MCTYKKYIVVNHFSSKGEAFLMGVAERLGRMNCIISYSPPKLIDLIILLNLLRGPCEGEDTSP